MVKRGRNLALITKREGHEFTRAVKSWKYVRASAQEGCSQGRIGKPYGFRKALRVLRPCGKNSNGAQDVFADRAHRSGWKPRPQGVLRHD